MIYRALTFLRAHTAPQAQFSNLVQRSVTREVSLSGDGSAAGWWKSRTHHPALIPAQVLPARRACTPAAGQLAGRARGNKPGLPLSSGPGVPR
jgi:hypothetical protein